MGGNIGGDGHGCGGEIQGVDACGFGNIGGFFYRDEDREGKDSEVEGRRGAEGAFYRVAG